MYLTGLERIKTSFYIRCKKTKELKEEGTYCSDFVFATALFFAPLLRRSGYFCIQKAIIAISDMFSKRCDFCPIMDNY